MPQFVEVEDKIIGPLTLKQFLFILVGGLLCFFYWKIFALGVIFFLLALPTMGFFVILAFAKINGRPILASLAGLLKFYFTSKVRVFSRTSETSFLVSKKNAPQEEKRRAEGGEVASRLKRLAYLLDQKTAEEERLIHSGQIREQWLNQI